MHALLLRRLGPEGEVNTEHGEELMQVQVVTSLYEVVKRVKIRARDGGGLH